MAKKKKKKPARRGREVASKSKKSARGGPKLPKQRQRRGVRSATRARQAPKPAKAAPKRKGGRGSAAPRSPRDKQKEQKARAKREAAQRAAVTRKRPHKRITSRTKRKTTHRIRYREVGFEFSDILSGRNPSNPHIRERFDAGFSHLVGKDMQVSFGVVIYADGERVGWTRVRRVARNFRGREDVAALANAAVREAMRQLGSGGEVYITSVSIQEYSE